MAEIIITLTDAQAEAIGTELQGYAEALANDRINQKAEKERADRIAAFNALTPEEQAAILAAAAENPPE